MLTGFKIWRHQISLKILQNKAKLVKKEKIDTEKNVIYFLSANKNIDFRTYLHPFSRF